MSFLVYLAGPITGISYGECTDWRKYAKEQLAAHNIIGVSPMRGKDYLKKEKQIGDAYNNTILSTEQAITCRDLFDVERSDAILVNLLGAARVSIGTVMEIAWAHLLRKPIVLAIEDGNVHDHAMIRAVSAFRVPTLEQAIDTAIAVVSPLSCVPTVKAKK